MHVPPPEPTFLGYIVKRVVRRPDWLHAPGVQTVCSVSDCISHEPRSKFTRWGFNGAGCYHTEQAAYQSIDQEDPEPYTRMALALYPVEFSKDGPTPVPVAELLRTDIGALPTSPSPDYRFIGFDVVSGRRAPGAGHMTAFDCSPLSCNGEAARVATNDYCLIDTWDGAVATAAMFGLHEPEPGLYYIFAVYLSGPVNAQEPEPPEVPTKSPGSQ